MPLSECLSPYLPLADTLTANFGHSLDATEAAICHPAVNELGNDTLSLQVERDVLFSAAGDANWRARLIMRSTSRLRTYGERNPLAHSNSLYLKRFGMSLQLVPASKFD